MYVILSCCWCLATTLGILRHRLMPWFWTVQFKEHQTRHQEDDGWFINSQRGSRAAKFNIINFYLFTFMWTFFSLFFLVFHLFSFIKYNKTKKSFLLEENQSSRNEQWYFVYLFFLSLKAHLNELNAVIRVWKKLLRFHHISSAFGLNLFF